MKIDDVLRAKLVKAVEAAGGARDFSRLCGINAANISRYLRGVITAVKDDNWEKLSPFLENNEPGINSAFEDRSMINASPALSAFIAARMKSRNIGSVEELRLAINCSSYELLRRQLYGKLNWFVSTLVQVFEQLGIDPGEAPLSVREQQLINSYLLQSKNTCAARMLPVISWQQNEDGYTTIAEPDTLRIPVLLDDHRELRAFRISGDLMKPTLNDGDVVLTEKSDVLTGVPENSIVIARYCDPASGVPSMACRRFHRLDDDRFILSCDNPEGGLLQLRSREINWISIIRERISKFS